MQQVERTGPLRRQNGRKRKEHITERKVKMEGKKGWLPQLRELEGVFQMSSDQLYLICCPQLQLWKYRKREKDKIHNHLEQSIRIIYALEKWLLFFKENSCTLTWWFIFRTEVLYPLKVNSKICPNKGRKTLWLLSTVWCHSYNTGTVLNCHCAFVEEKNDLSPPEQ